MNDDHVILTSRTLNDHDHPKKLEIAKPVKSVTNYEAYTRGSISTTKNAFSRAISKVVKFPAALQLQNQRDLFKANPSIKQHLDKELRLAD